MTVILRDYQQRAVLQVEAAWASGERRIVLSMPTGAGKTEVALAMNPSGPTAQVSVNFPSLAEIDRRIAELRGLPSPSHGANLIAGSAVTSLNGPPIDESE